MKSKTVIRSKQAVMKWIEASNLFAKSRISSRAALSQFNQLSARQRAKIKSAFDECDKVRRIKIPKDEIESSLEISVMVDAHIIATENGIDPLTAVMCISPPCKNGERILVK